jgi:hypothetical protein
MSALHLFEVQDTTLACCARTANAWNRQTHIMASPSLEPAGWMDDPYDTSEPDNPERSAHDMPRTRVKTFTYTKPLGCARANDIR